MNVCLSVSSKPSWLWHPSLIYNVTYRVTHEWPSMQRWGDRNPEPFLLNEICCPTIPNFLHNHYLNYKNEMQSKLKASVLSDALLKSPNSGCWGWNPLMLYNKLNGSLYNKTPSQKKKTSVGKYFHFLHLEIVIMLNFKTIYQNEIKSTININSQNQKLPSPDWILKGVFPLCSTQFPEHL